jgi:ABC-type multidrug transport system fused ATPase/permease subunit
MKLLAKYLVATLFMPFQIGAALYLMFDFIGLSFLGGCAVIGVTGLINYFLAIYIWRLQKRLMKSKDERTRLTNELFSQIKSIKVNAFEEHFISKILIAREAEMSILRRRFLIGCINVLLFGLSPMVIINATIAMYIYLGNTLNAADTFTLISLF